MPSRVLVAASLAGLAMLTPAVAEEKPIDINTDLEGQYFIVEKAGTPDKPIVLVRRAATSYDYYVKREFDCGAHTVRHLGEGESLKDVAASEPEAKMSAIAAGSIADQLSRLVCPSKTEKEAGDK